MQLQKEAGLFKMIYLTEKRPSLAYLTCEGVFLKDAAPTKMKQFLYLRSDRWLRKKLITMHL